ncbi:hypothetical protein CLOM_g6889 [Closterium sp. NIES-68]|nr:hypothetical protein CLOM_g6889 [Closterium sp. NIES-68]
MLMRHGTWLGPLVLCPAAEGEQAPHHHHISCTMWGGGLASLGALHHCHALCLPLLSGWSLHMAVLA